jgi:hypothetical protein
MVIHSDLGILTDKGFARFHCARDLATPHASRPLPECLQSDCRYEPVGMAP